jgi:sporulation protein YlmC with PRC-barrel domain
MAIHSDSKVERVQEIKLKRKAKRISGLAIAATRCAGVVNEPSAANSARMSTT